MFYGRNEELKKLNDMYMSGKFECAVIYGRRRVGKTTLIREFVKDKDAIYFLAREADGRINLNGFSNDLYSVTATELVNNSFFADWEKAFDYIYQISKDKRLVLAIDEFPYLAQGHRPISSILQAHIDMQLKDSKLFLILCGSSMSFMENQVLAYQSPLYGRRTAQFKIEPLDFYESLPFFEAYSSYDKAVLYGITGGIPEYLNKIDSSKTVDENIIELFLTPSGHLFEEPTNLLKQELREPSTYNGIIDAIASGASRLNEIATKCSMDSNKCGKYLASLMSLGIVKKEIPITETSSKRSIYRLDDMMFRFWYRYVFPYMSNIVSGLGRALYENEVSINLSDYMGLVFEEICKQYLIKEAKNDNLSFFFSKIGRWWGNNPLEKRQEEVDILAFHRDSALFCECKWTNTPVDIDALLNLERRSGLFSYKSNQYWIFSKTGFTDKLVFEAANRSNIRLLSFEEMLS